MEEPAARATVGAPRAEPPDPPEGPPPPLARARHLTERARSGDRRALARLLTEVENRSVVAEEALRILYPLAGRAHLVGVTGAPGSGKSTLVAALVAQARRDGRPVAVVAIDPSSPITGGAILGDRVRMQEHAGDRDVFIRSMASRGHAGGLAAASVAAAAVLDAVGFPLIFLETVGTGQGEVEVAAVADTTIVVEAPEMGDEVQAIKAGLLEVADLVVVTKGDRPGAQRAAAQLRAMLALGERPGGGDRVAGPKRPPVLLVTAPSGEGIDTLLATLDQRWQVPDRTDADVVRRARASTQLEGVLAERLRQRLRAAPYERETARLVQAIADHELDPYTAADRLLSLVGHAAEG